MTEKVEKIVDISPKSLTEKECSRLSSNPQLRKEYEDKWGKNIAGTCGIKS